MKIYETPNQQKNPFDGTDVDEWSNSIVMLFPKFHTIKYYLNAMVLMKFIHSILLCCDKLVGKSEYYYILQL